MFARFFVAALIAIGTLSVAMTAGGRGSTSSAPAITMHYTSFSPSALTVKAGEPITFELRNDDPIEHEWMIGDDEMHERHRTGTHAIHDEIPTEVTVPAFTTKLTTITFDEPGEYEFICHLPGHEEYGMKGVVRVVE
jgi:uncharacterized cupredoxin-like copper-binding protein